jgi:hypothetical protein
MFGTEGAEAIHPMATLSVTLANVTGANFSLRQYLETDIGVPQPSPIGVQIVHNPGLRTVEFRIEVQVRQRTFCARETTRVSNSMRMKVYRLAGVDDAGRELFAIRLLTSVIRNGKMFTNGMRLDTDRDGNSKLVLVSGSAYVVCPGVGVDYSLACAFDGAYPLPFVQVPCTPDMYVVECRTGLYPTKQTIQDCLEAAMRSAQTRAANQAVASNASNPALVAAVLQARAVRAGDAAAVPALVSAVVPALGPAVDSVMGSAMGAPEPRAVGLPAASHVAHEVIVPYPLVSAALLPADFGRGVPPPPPPGESQPKRRRTDEYPPRAGDPQN